MKMSLPKTIKTFLFLLVVTISSLFILSQSSGLGLKEISEFKDLGLKFHFDINFKQWILSIYFFYHLTKIFFSKKFMAALYFYFIKF